MRKIPKPKSKVKKVLFVAMSIAFCLVATPTFAENYNLTNCTTLNESSTYYLENNINTTLSLCMNISASNSIFDCQGHFIDGDDTNTLSGIKATNVDNITIKNCILYDSTIAAIYLDYSPNSSIINCTLISNDDSNNYAEGIQVYESDNCIVDNCTFIANWYGILLNFVSNVTLSNLNIEGSLWGGFSMDNTANGNNFSSINISNSYNAFWIGGSNNTFSNLRISNSTNAEFEAYYNEGEGGNTIYNSMLNDTTYLLLDTNIKAQDWNTTIGNFWTNSTGNGWSDTCNCLENRSSKYGGICSEPYVIDENNTDYLPLCVFQAQEQNETIPLNATTNVTTGCCPISTFYCSDNDTLIQLWNTSDGISFAYQACADGCDNVSAACSPPPYQQNLIIIGILIVVGIIIIKVAT